VYAIFFSGEGVAIKVPVKKGKGITGKYYKDVVLKKLKKYKRNDALSLVLSISVLCMTMSPLIPPLKEEKVTVLPHLRILRTLPHVIFFLLPKLKSFLAGRKYKSRQALGSAIHQYLITGPKLEYRDAFKKWIHRLKLCISSHGEYFEGMK
jgi:hypothetical protein